MRVLLIRQEMSRFFKEEYHKSATDVENLSVQRNTERGFNPFIMDALESLDQITSDRQQQMSLCELGIGGGGSHDMLMEHTQDSHILGVDLFSKDNFESYNSHDHRNQMYVDNWDRLVKDQYDSQHNLDKTWQEQLKNLDTQPNRKPSLLYGLDAYKKSTAEHLVALNGAKLDYVNDDASPNLGALNGLMHAYQDAISDSGILISTGPFGNGTPEAYDRWENGIYLKDISLLAKQGFVVFDMTEYRHRCHLNSPETKYILSYLAMWTPNFNNYKDLLVKYEHNIVKGKENWKHD